MDSIKQRLHSVLQRIRDAEERFGRPNQSVKLLAVSKTWPKEYVLEAYDANQRAFGENYIQEAVEKIDTIEKDEIEWHYIGAIQSNKTQLIAPRFDWVHSVDRFKIAQRLNDQRPDSLPPLNVCIQINISNEDSKSGVIPGELKTLAQSITQLPKLRLRGLMAIPASEDDFGKQRAIFKQVRELQEALIDDGLPLNTLSMGMSGDLEAAIAEGSTLVRIGTAIFGQRNYTA